MRKFSKKFSLIISHSQRWTYVDGQKLKKISREIKFSSSYIYLKEEKLFIWHNKTSNVELSEQRISQVLLRNFCSYRTHGFYKIYAFRKNIFAKKISPHLFSRIFEKKFAKWDRKCLHFFAKTFCSLETLFEIFNLSDIGLQTIGIRNRSLWKRLIPLFKSKKKNDNICYNNVLWFIFYKFCK